MNKDRLTTILGMLVGGMVAAKSYLESSGDLYNAQFWVGMVMAVGTALWGYWTNKK